MRVVVGTIMGHREGPGPRLLHLGPSSRLYSP